MPKLVFISSRVTSSSYMFNTILLALIEKKKFQRLAVTLA